MKRYIRNKIGEWPFRKQLAAFYGMMISIVFFAMLVFLLYFKDNAVKERMETILRRDGYRIQTNFDSLIGRADEYSKVIMFSSATQELLSSHPKVSGRTQMDSIYTIIGSTFIDSIYVYDFDGNKYAASSGSYVRERTTDITEAAWYSQVMDKKGGYILVKNSGGFLKEDSLDKDYVSFIRVVNDIDTQRPVGILIMNLNEKSIEDTQAYILKEYDTIFFIRNEAGEIIYHTPNGGEKFLEMFDRQKTEDVVYDGERYVCTEINLMNGWSEVLAFKHDEVGSEYRQLFFIFGGLLLASLLVLVLGTAYFSNRISRPLKEIVSSMSALDDRSFRAVGLSHANKEIDRLQAGYNYMLGEIQRLLGEMQQKEKQKRKFELNLLQSQIRPHFLYNSFDAVSALALMKRTDDIFTMMQALGKYYRLSLHKGDEIIPMSDEISIIENYLIIMRYRFDGKFRVIYDVDEEVKNIPVLKLTMQPFVENAIFHGMKVKKEGGTLTIRVKRKSDHTMIQIADDGAGMDERELDRMLGGEAESRERGFGVRSTVKRLELYYDTDHIIHVQSSVGKGTVITIKIPMAED